MDSSTLRRGEENRSSMTPIKTQRQVRWLPDPGTRPITNRNFFLHEHYDRLSRRLGRLLSTAKRWIAASPRVVRLSGFFFFFFFGEFES